MLTPQEVSQHAFSKASFGGYNMAMVDEFLDQLTEDYTTLYKENAVLKSKMKVLVDKVEEYRATEDGMRKALLAAQKTADEIIADAQARREALIGTAEGEARAKIDALRTQLESEQLRLTAAQNATAAYVDKLKELYQHELEYLNGLSQLTAPAPGSVETAAREIETTMQKVVEEETPGPAECEISGDAEESESAEDSEGGLYAELMELNLDRQEKEGGKRERSDPRDKGERGRRPYRREDAGANAEEEDDAPTRRIDFSNLKFGKDYEIK